jgi:lipoprotein
MKKKFVGVLLIVAMTVVTLAGCGGKANVNKKPEVLSDLFDGKQRVWFYLDRSDLYDGLAYDTDVKAVIITENKQVIGYYYNLIGIYNKDMISGEEGPFANSRFLLSDFSGLTDSEIIEKVSETYADGSVTYPIEIQTSIKKYTYEGEELPYTIEYDGELDSSGNGLENETLYFFDTIRDVMFPFNQSYQNETLYRSFKFDSLVEPTVIKEKEYIGIQDTSGNMLITLNNYAEFENIMLDKPEGM